MGNLMYSRSLRWGNKQGTLSAAPAVNLLASVPWVAQWKFNNDGQDSIGANNLTANNSPTFTTGKLGGATGATQLVAASSQYWSIADNAALGTGDLDYTICAWAYAESFGGYRLIISKQNSGVPDAEYFLGYHVVQDRLAFISRNTDLALANDVGTPALATWYCLIAWYDSVLATVNLQINNGSVNTVARTVLGAHFSSAVRIGAINSDPGSFWNGRIDNVCIAKSAAGGGGVLSAAARSAFYAAGVGTENLV